MAQPRLIKDLLPGTTFVAASQWKAVADLLFFTANDGSHGVELWVSDGTTSGTVLVADVWPGAQGSTPSNLTLVGDTLFFVANDGLSGRELWASDWRKAGLEGSTHRLGDLLPGPAGSSPSRLTPLGTTLFFIGGDPIAPSLWRSDGTLAGTVQITPTPANPWGHFPSGLTALGSSLLFNADFDNGRGKELWISDGTTAGTVLLQDLWPGPGDSNPLNLTVLGNTAFFCAGDPIAGRELWKTDGTAAGTVRVKDIQPGGASSDPDNFIVAGNRLFFTARAGNSGAELWMSDGTDAGTVLVKSIWPGPTDPWSLSVNFKAKALGNLLLFTGDDGTNGVELWRSDGTAAGTALVRDIWPGPGSSLPDYFSSCNNLLYFSASNPSSGTELWRSDGTEEGTYLVADLTPGTASSRPMDLNAVANTLFFNASDPEGKVESWALAPDPFPTSAFLIKALASTKPEGQSATTPFTFLIRRSGAIDQATSVRWTVTGTGDHPATLTDFVGATLPDNLLSFGPGQTSRTVTVNVVGDTSIEPDETFRVSLTPSGADTITIDSATGTIVNDDNATSQAVALWKQGLDQVAWAKVSLANLVGGPNSSSTYTISLPFLDGSTGLLQFEGTGLQVNAQGLPAAGTVTKGTLSKGGRPLAQNRFYPTAITSIFGVVAGDLLDDGRLGEPTLALLRSNLDLRPALSIAAPALAQRSEGNGSPSLFVFRVARAGDISVSSTVRWSVKGSGSQPANAADFLGDTTGILTFDPWIASQTLTVAVNGDTAAEANETFAVSLFSATGAIINPTAASASATIVNDDTGLAIAPLAAVKAEGNRGATPFTFRVSRLGVSTGSSSARWAVASVGANGATGADFIGAALPEGSVSFAPGQTSRTITIAVAGDTIPEANASFQVSLSEPMGATLSAAVAIGTISNDDPLPTLRIEGSGNSQAEGNGEPTPFLFTVRRRGNTTGTSSALWSVNGQGSQPANAADFLGAMGGTVSFAPGVSAQTLTVLVKGDTAVEPNETFAVALWSPTAANVDPAARIASATIRNDDTAFAIAPLSASKAEGRSGSTAFPFTISRSGVTTAAASLHWSASGTGANPAAPEDFIGPTAGTLTFEANQTSLSLTLQVRGDMVQEADETFTFTVSTPTGANLASASAMIRNDDIMGSERAEVLQSGPNIDTLTGLGGADVFAFRFTSLPTGPSDSPLTAPDLITDFAFGEDRISLSHQGLLFEPGLIRAADNSTASTLAALTASVFADANGARPGNQPLGANTAALVLATNPAIAGVYLLVNNGVAGRSSSDDLLIKLGGFTGSLPALGVIAPGVVFV